MWRLVFFMLMAFSLDAQVIPFPNAHAHNDYEHERPLFDALDHGFCSVEADIWSVNGELLVAHDKEDLQPGRTIQSLYLDPLRERIRANGGRVYPAGPDFILLVDFKSSWRKTYPLFRKVLEEYSDILTSFTSDSTTSGAVTVIISGNRSKRALNREAMRYAAMDGRLSDLKRPVNSHLMPMISDKWSRVIGREEGPPFSDDTLSTLREYADKAHSQGATLRFWGVPHDEEVWKILLDVGVDHINVDDLGRLRDFLALREE